MDKISDVVSTLQPAWAKPPEAAGQSGTGQPVPEAPLRSEQRTTPLLDRSQFPQGGTLPASGKGLRFREEESASSEEGSIYSEDESVYSEEDSVYSEDDSVYSEEDSVYSEDDSVFSEEEGSLDAAVRQQDPAAIDAALLSGADLTRQARENPMLLHALAELAHVNEVRFLVDADAYVNRRSDRRRTPLIHAAVGGSAQVIEVLLDHGADAGKRDDAGNTALHVAVLCRQYAAAAALLGRMSRREIEQQNKRGYSALFEAVWLEDAPMTRLLLKGGAQVDCHSQLNFNIVPLMRAAARGNAEVLANLLAAGANPNEPDWMAATALFYAVRGGSLACVEALLDAGADINTHDNRYFTPLLCAVELSKTDMVDALLRHGAVMTHHARLVGDISYVSCKTEDAEFDYEGGPGRLTLNPPRPKRVPQPALLFAVSKGLDEMTALLLDAGADVNFVAANGDTALDKAIELGHRTIVERLLAYGARQ
jgi:ankyrin repeat protein